MRIVFAGGGTGGHIYPALAIAGSLKEKVKDIEIVYIAGSKSMERDIVGKAGLRVETLPVVGMPRKLSPALIGFSWKLGVSIVKSINVLRRLKPKAVVATGGYVSGPPLIAAKMLGIPALIQEQNSYPGITNRKLGRYADMIFLGFSEAAKYFPANVETIHTGNPVRNSVGAGERTASAKVFGLDPEKKTVLVFGGSQGARAINTVVAEIAKALATQGIQLIWQSGKNEFDQYSAFDDPTRGIRVLPYIEDMASAYGASDMVVARAGAMSISEITTCGLPVIFVPLPTAAGNHQEFNARSLVDAGAATMILQRDLSGESLLKEIETLLHDAPLLNERAAASKKYARENAAENIADIIAEKYLHRN